MKILMLNYEFPPIGGGAGNACYYMLKEFSKMDVEIDLVTSSPGKYKEEKFSKNIRIFKLDVGKKNVHYWKMSEILKWTRKAYKFSKRLVNDRNYDLCHCWFGWPCGWIGYKLRKKIPYIVALRGSDVPGYNPRLKLLDWIVFKRLSKKIWKNAEKVIANSSGLRELALKTRKQKIDIIPNGINIQEFKPKYRKNKRLELVSVGRLIPRKGYLHLLKAVKGLDVKLTLIGEGNQEKELKEFAEKNKLNVKFLGKVNHSDIVKFYQKSDVFVLPSLNEGMSNSVLEAMGCGLPVIVTDTGGKELINGNGFVVPVKDSEKLRDCIVEYAGNSELVKKHGKKSRDIALKLGWDRVAKDYFKVYRGI